MLAAYPSVNEMIKVFDVNGFDHVDVGDEQVGHIAVKDSDDFAIFFHQTDIVGRHVLFENQILRLINNLFIKHTLFQIPQAFPTIKLGFGPGMP